MIHTFELTKDISQDEYETISKQLGAITYVNKTAVYRGLYTNGITVFFSKNIYNKAPECIRIKYQISPSRLTGSRNHLALYEYSRDDRITEKINELLMSKSHHLPCVEQCLLSRCDFTFDTRWENEDMAKSYIRLLNRAYIPNGFERYMIYSKSGKRTIPSKNDFNIYIQNKINIDIYNKKEAMKDHNKKSRKALRYTQDELDCASGIIRFEIRCMGSIMRKLCENKKANTLEKFLESSSYICDELFSYYFKRIFGKGFFHTLNDAIYEINNSGFYKNTKAELVDFLKTANEKRSINKAFEQMKYTTEKDKKCLLSAFDKIHLGYITVPGRMKKILLCPVPSPYILYCEYGNKQLVFDNIPNT